MANYFLKSADNTKAYRVAYTVDGQKITIDGCYCTGNGVTLPSAGTVSGVDLSVLHDDVLVDFALANVAVCTVDDYRSIATTVMTALATVEVNSYAARW